MPAKRRRKLTFSKILDLAKSVLYNHLQALHRMPSTEEQVKGEAMLPSGFLTTDQAEFVRKVMNDTWKIHQAAGAAGNAGGDLSSRPSTELANALTELLEKQGAEPTRRANRGA